MDVFGYNHNRSPFGNAGTIRKRFDDGMKDINGFHDRCHDFFLNSGRGLIDTAMKFCKDHPYDNRVRLDCVDMGRCYNIFSQYLDGVEKLLDELKSMNPTSEITPEMLDKLKRASLTYNRFITELFKGTIKDYDNDTPLCCKKSVADCINNVGFLIDYEDKLKELSNKMYRFIIDDSANPKYNGLYGGIANVYISSIITFNNSLLLYITTMLKNIEKAINERPKPVGQIKPTNKYQVF